MSTSKTRAWAGGRPALRPVRRGLKALCVGLVGALAGQGALATLGDSAASIARDRAALHGAPVTHTTAASFEIAGITTGDGIEVRQYVSRSGTVFATTWSGRALPDLKVLLGAHYYRYAAQVTAVNSNSKVVSISTADLVVQFVRLPRGFTGSAFLPALLPPGANISDIR